MVTVRMDVDALHGAVADLRGFFDGAMDQWTAVANASARALGETARLSTGLSTHLPAVADLARDLEARVDLAVLVNTGDDGKAPAGVVEYTLPGSLEAIEDVYQALGEQLAGYAGTEHARDTPEGMAALNERLARYSDNPEVMAAFYETMPTGGLLDLMAITADGFYGDDDISIELRTSVLEHLKAGLHTADEHWTDAESAAYADDLVQMATGEDEASWDYDFSSSFPSALSYLLYDSDFSNSFLSTAANAIDTYERVTRDGEAGQWSRRMMGMNTWIGYFPDDALSATWDPTVSLMSALGNNPEVSLDFFMADSQNGSVSERQMYWIHDRTWQDDQFVHLSEALLAATTDPKVIAPWDSESAAQAALLASQTVNLIGHRPGIDGDILTSDDGGDSAAGNFATILSTYMHGVDTSVSVSPGTWNEGSAGDIQALWTDSTLVNVPLFDLESLAKFSVYAAATEEGLTTLRGGLDTYAHRKYSLSIEELGNDLSNEAAREMFENAYKGQARMEGLFMNAVGDSAVAEAKGDDETRKMWASLASDTVGLIPFGGIVTKAGGGAVAEKLISFTIDQGRSSITDDISEQWASLAAAEEEIQNDAAQLRLDQASYQVLSSMVANGNFAQDTSVPSWSEYVALPDSEKAELRSRLLNPVTGVGTHFDAGDFEEAYKREFSEYFGE